MNFNLKTDTQFSYWKTLVHLEILDYVNLIFSTGNFMKSKYQSKVSNENLVSEQRCAVGIKYTPDFKDSMRKRM